MEQLTKCEKTVYQTMLDTDKRIMELKEITDLVNRKNSKNWTKRSIKYFLERLIEKECIKKERHKWKWCYEVTVYHIPH